MPPRGLTKPPRVDDAAASTCGDEAAASKRGDVAAASKRGDKADEIQ